MAYSAIIIPASISLPVTVANGGTGIATTTAYGLITGGVTSTGNFQNAGVGTSGQVYVSNGPGSLGTWTTLATGVTSIAGTANQITASASTGAVTLSIPATAIIAATSLTAGSNIVITPNTITNSTSGNNLNLATTGAGGGISITSNWFGGAAATPFRLYNAGNTQYVGLQAGTLSASTTWTLPTADTATAGYAIVSNASGALSFAPAGSVQIGTTQTASSSASLGFLNLITSSFSRFYLICDDLVPATTSANLKVRFSVNGSTYDSSALYSNTYIALHTGNTVAGTSQFNGTSFQLNYDACNTSTKTYFVLEIVNPSGAQANKQCHGRMSNISGSAIITTLSDLTYTNTTAVQGVEVFFDNGNIASGTAKLYALV